MSRRLITDRDVMLRSTGAPIVLDAGTLITPSARDRAARLGIPVLEAGARTPVRCAGCGTSPCACAAAAAACPSCGGGGAGALPALAGQPDGAWLVRVEGGRIVSALPAAGAGQMTRARPRSAR